MKPYALVVSAALALGAVVLPSSATAATAPSASLVFAATDSGQLIPGEDLVITGTVSNVSDNDLPASTATAFIDRSLVSSRSDLDAWVSSTTSVATDKLGTAIGSASIPGIPAGKSVGVTVTVPATAVGLDASAAWGAREIAVRVTSGQTDLGQSRSTIVWNPDGSVGNVSLALAMPLTVPASSVGLIPSATLATYTAPDGLLTRELDQAIDRRIAIGIDPMIIASIRILGNSAPPTAITWLARLAAAGNETFALTYADYDVAAAHQAGVSTVLAPTSFAIDPRLFPGYTAAPTGSPTAGPSSTPIPNPTVTAPPPIPTTDTLTDFTYTTALAGTVWPSDDTVVESDLDAFSTQGYHRTILSSGNLSFGDLDYTPSAAAIVNKQQALVSDEALSRLFRAAVSAPDDVTWQKDVDNLSATIATISRQKGPVDRQLLATLDRGGDGQYFRLAQTMQVLDGVPWSSVEPLSALTTTPGSTAATIDGKGESESRISTVKSLISSESQVAAFGTVLDDPTVLTGERRLSLLAVLANSWNNDPPAWPDAAQKYLGASTKTLKSVTIAQTGSQALLSDTVNLGVSVTNNLPWPVTVNVMVRSPSGAITVTKPRVLLTVEADSQARASIPIRALANGDVTVRASLSSPTGVAIGRHVDLDVNVQAGWESAITAIVAVLLVLLFAFGIYRNFIKRRRQRKAEAAPEDTVTGE